jgi:DNA-binding transcriptional LysR family regulator
MTLHDLNIFATAARLGSITRTAEILATVQSNVTTRIRLLEEEFGTSLFQRHHRGIRLTPKGGELLPYAQQILVLAEKAREKISNRANNPHSALRIGCLHSTAASRLPDILKDYARRYGQADIAVETGIASELIDRVLDGRLAGAFVSGLVERPELDAIEAFVEEAVVLTPPAYRTVRQYLRRGPVPKVLVFRAGCSYRQKLQRYLLSEGFGQLDEMEFGTFDGIIGCVGAGVGIALLPRSVVDRSPQREGVNIHRLPKEIRCVETFFVTRKGDVPSSTLERLMGIITVQR